MQSGSVPSMAPCPGWLGMCPVVLLAGLGAPGNASAEQVHFHLPTCMHHQTVNLCHCNPLATHPAAQEQAACGGAAGIGRLPGSS